MARDAFLIGELIHHEVGWSTWDFLVIQSIVAVRVLGRVGLFWKVLHNKLRLRNLATGRPRRQPSAMRLIDLPLPRSSIRCHLGQQILGMGGGGFLIARTGLDQKPTRAGGAVETIILDLVIRVRGSVGLLEGHVSAAFGTPTGTSAASSADETSRGISSISAASRPPSHYGSSPTAAAAGSAGGARRSFQMRCPTDPRVAAAIAVVVATDFVTNIAGIVASYGRHRQWLDVDRPPNAVSIAAFRDGTRTGSRGCAKMTMAMMRSLA